MRRTRIKVCGITNIEDALLCARCGADALGFIFVPVSPRAVTQENAAAIIARLPAFVCRVGVFMDADIDFAVETALYCGLSVFQLHGAETPEYTEELKRRTKLTILKTFRPAETGAQEAMAGYPADAFLLDSAAAGKRAGGTGMEIDPVLVCSTVGQSEKPVMLAGGMRPDNVGERIRLCRPWGVDVCSGTEDARGRKSEVKVIDFFKAVLRADAEY